MNDLLGVRGLTSLVAFAGTLVAASANYPPTSQLLNPPQGTLLSAGDTIQLEAQGNDSEGALTKIEFHANGSLLGEDFLPPYTLWWSNITEGIYSLQAVAVDDGFARGTSFVVTVTVSAPTPRTLEWSPTRIPNFGFLDWNSTVIHWRSAGRYTVFHPGDSVLIQISSFPSIFIGTDGTPAPVSPATTILRGNGGISGGDILTGGLTIEGARIVFSNYTSSLSFPGGTLIQPSPGLTFDISAAPASISVHFGTGPITNNASTFTFQTGDIGASLENDFVVRSFSGSAIAVNPTVRPFAVVRFSGTLYLGADLRFQAFSDNLPARPPHHWTGPVVIEQSVNRIARLIVSGQTPYSKGLVLSGNISDGPGDATNALALSVYPGNLRIAGTNNTYRFGTRIEQSYPYAVEVAPESSLGTGDVLATANLTLLGNRNIASNANVALSGGGRIALGRNVKIRLNSLRLGPNTYTNGLFSGTNIMYGAYLTSNGSFRLPTMNLNPTVSITNPVGVTSFLAGQTISMAAQASDIDSYVTHVEFRLNGIPFAMRTNVPYQASLREAPAGIYQLQAIAYDDDGGVGSSSVVIANVQPRIDRILRHPPNLVILEFDAPMLHPYALEATDTLPATTWNNILSFPAETTRRRVQVTNDIPEDVITRFYRLVLP